MGTAAARLWPAPSVALRAPPPPVPGEDFSGSALQLAGFAGAFLGWAPDAFWRATPAELGAVVRALGGGEAVMPPDAGMLARLRKAYPDG